MEFTNAGCSHVRIGTWRGRTLGLFTSLLLAASQLQAGDLAQLRVLYVGSERADEYVEFLQGFVSHVEAVRRDEFRPEDGDAFDVVLLDWPQSPEARDEREEKYSPLGGRDDWGRPTVLLGSAGLNLACVWQLRGGSGCTCLDPIAYDLKDHPIFQTPFHIDREATVEIETPPSFQDDLEAESIHVIPLVNDTEDKWRSGWCTYSTAFDVYPDVEFFCGGVNDKTPTAAAIWRQGNLLHYGFQQSPREMNEVGNHLLLNAIAYISHFSEDRPISISPSVFVDPCARPRATVASWLEKPSRVSWVENMVQPELWEVIQLQETPEGMVAWAKDNTRFFTTDAEFKIGLDEDLQSVRMAFDDQGFIESMIKMLDSTDSTTSERALRLLKRYVPNGPKSDREAWKDWYGENQPFLFATDFGHYRWYVDPLAKERGVPTRDLRGVDRMDQRRVDSARLSR